MSFSIRSISILIQLVLALHMGAAVIHGQAPDMAGERIVLYTYADQVSELLEKQDETVVDSDGNFKLTADISSIRLARLTVDFTMAHLYLEPDGSYVIEYPAPPTDAPRRFGKEAETEVIFTDLSPDDINSDIIDFNVNYDLFFQKNYELLRRLFSPRDQAVQSDSNAVRTLQGIHPSRLLFNKVKAFRSTMDSIYAEGDDPYFALYRNAVIGQLMLNGNSDLTPRQFFQEFIEPHPVAIHHPEHIALLREFYKYYLVKNTDSFGEEKLDSAININGSYTELSAIMEADDFVARTPLRELVMCLALEEIWNGSLNRTMGIQILEHIAEQGASEESRTIARNLIAKLSSRAEGLPIMDFEFTDQFNEVHRISDLKGRPILIGFDATWCTRCKEEQATLQTFLGEYARDIHHIQFLIHDGPEPRDDRPLLRSSLQATEDIYSPLIRQLGIVNLPFFILVDENGVVVKDQIPLPSEGLEAQLHRITTEDPVTRSRPIGSKEN
ncbi:MAG: TlpA family protein disulfide reductase [Flavobacteriales bacterium]|nr:TlpA family protein disulfide reductase [Flavobacteriales bacterium]